MEVESIAWKQEFSVGLTFVDTQHKRFLNIINELGQCIADKKEKEKGKPIFFSLLHFTEEFLHKEKIMANSIDAIDYSYFRDKHSQFITKLKSFKDEYVESDNNEKFTELYSYLKNSYKDFFSCYTPSLIKILKTKGIN